MIQRLIPDIASPGAREKRVPGLRALLLGKGQSQETARKWSFTKSQWYLRKSQAGLWPPFPRFYENMLSQVLLSLQMCHEKVPTELCWSLSLAVFLVFWYKAAPRRGSAHTPRLAERWDWAQLLSDPAIVPSHTNQLIRALVISPGWVRGTSQIFVSA